MLREAEEPPTHTFIFSLFLSTHRAALLYGTPRGVSNIFKDPLRITTLVVAAARSDSPLLHFVPFLLFLDQLKVRVAELYPLWDICISERNKEKSCGLIPRYIPPGVFPSEGNTGSLDPLRYIPFGISPSAKETNRCSRSTPLREECSSRTSIGATRG